MGMLLGKGVSQGRGTAATPPVRNPSFPQDTPATIFFSALTPHPPPEFAPGHPSVRIAPHTPHPVHSTTTRRPAPPHRFRVPRGTAISTPPNQLGVTQILHAAANGNQE